MQRNSFPTPTPVTKSPSSNGVNGSPHPPPQHLAVQQDTPVNSIVEDMVNKLFANKDTEVWSHFSHTLMAAFRTTLENIAKMRFIFDPKGGGAVDKTSWYTFTQWFTPMSSNESPNGGYTIEDIIRICGPAYFHGFLGSNEAQKELKGKMDNTYLLRFSSQHPGCYALSVSYNHTVGHWRISCEKRPYQEPIFRIDGREYKSLADIIQTHAINGEPLKIKQPREGQSGNCWLGTPLIRQETSEDYYQVT